MTSASAGTDAHWFIVPPAGKPPSGGDRFNDGLLAALERVAPGLPCVRIESAALADAPLERARGVVWLDSLLLGMARDVRARLAGDVPLLLIAHALPTDLAGAGDLHAIGVAGHETTLLQHVQGALAPSETMAEGLRMRIHTLPVWVVEPAVRAAPSRVAVATNRPLAALMIGHLVPNKGLLPLLYALRAQRDEAPSFQLRCVGRTDADRAYARACAEVLRAAPVLAVQVSLVGALPYEAVLAELGSADLLVSASRTESFGMAIADARATGVPVLARRGGHVAALVDPSSGGELATDDDELARSLLALAADPAERARRLARARAHRLPERSWDDVARAFLSIRRHRANVTRSA